MNPIDVPLSQRLSIAARLMIFVALQLVFGTGVVPAGEIDLGHPTSRTPYDRYNGPVRQVFGNCGAATVSVETVRSQLRTARRFRYYYDPANPYEPALPEVTEAKRAGDCKAKALWLAQKMGDSRARYVVGKIDPNARLGHAWLLWPKSGTWYAVDPTNETDLLLAERIVGRKLFPHYSYNGQGAFVHPSYLTYVK
jgi:hypothetical protein